MNARHSRRRGYSLVELMIAMAFLATISSALGAVVSQIINGNSQARQGEDDAMMLCRLGEQFRADARAAVNLSASEAPAGPQSLILTSNDGSVVRYDIEDSGLRRTKTASGLPVEQERYSLAKIRILGWRVDETRSGEIAIVMGRVIPRPGDEDSIGKQFDLVGVLGGRGNAEVVK